MLAALTIASCEEDNLGNRKTLKSLYKTYKNGQISECDYKGEIVYSAARNAYDAGGAIYDKKGNLIGTCNFAWGPVDSICSELQSCKPIYRVEDNIWGQPRVDKYRLGK